MKLLGIDNVFFEVDNADKAIDLYEKLGFQIKSNSKFLHSRANVQNMSFLIFIFWFFTHDFLNLS